MPELTYPLTIAVKLSSVCSAVNSSDTISVDAIDGIVDINNHLFLLGDETPLAYLIRFLQWKGIDTDTGWLPSQAALVE